MVPAMGWEGVEARRKRPWGGVYCALKVEGEGWGDVGPMVL